MRTYFFLISLLLSTGNCTLNQPSALAGRSMKFVGSTPCDNSLKSIIGIPANDSVDFMRWELVLEKMPSFVLSINYGLSRPNTTGFEPGDKTITITGKFENRYIESQNFKGEVYDLISRDLSDTLSLVKPGNHILHILEADNSLMVGNGGWSYTLNRTNNTDNIESYLVTMVPVENVLNDTSLKVIFEGRTPCSEISKVFDFNRPLDCIKLKWSLILNRDPVTLKPSTYKLQRTDIRDTGIATGKWTVFCLSDSTVVYKLDPDKPEKSISILAGDENVLFFLDKYNRLFSGNGDFSYTLNRRNPV